MLGGENLVEEAERDKPFPQLSEQATSAGSECEYGGIRDRLLTN